MVDFSPDTIEFNDQVGLGAWLIGHQREHSDFVVLLAQQTPPVLIGDYPFLDLGSTKLTQRVWLDTHQTIHNLLRGQTGVSGIDLVDVDLSDADQWYEWQAAHATEHAQLRAAFGIS